MNNHLLRPNSLYGITVVLILLCIGLYCVPFSIMGNDLAYIPGDIGDAGLTYYLLEHGFQWLSGSQESFWNAPFFYPEPMVVTFADSLSGTLPLYSVFRLFGLDRETSFQWWIITIFILNYISCVWVLRKFSISLPGAAAGAFIFTFSLPVIARLGHIHLTTRFMVPLAFYFTWSYLKKPDLKSLTGLCLSIAWQFYCAIYIGFFLVLSIVAFILSSAIINPKHYKWREIFWGSVSKFACRTAVISASGLILLPLLLPYFITSLDYGLREWSQISTMLPRIQSLVMPVHGSLLWNWLRPLGHNLPMPWEHIMFIGVLPWIAVIYVIFSFRINNNYDLSVIGKAAALSIVLIILIVLYWDGFSFYKYISFIPGVKAFRAVSRIILVLSFLFAISVGVLFTRLEGHKINKSSNMTLSVFIFILLGVLVADQYVFPNSQNRFSKSSVQFQSQSLAAEVLKKNPSAKVFAYMPSKSSDPLHVIHMYAMLASQIIHIPTINGYSGSVPRNYDLCLNYNKHWALKQWITLNKAKYGKYYNSTDNSFDGLVIVGAPENNTDSHPISIAHEALPNEGFKAAISPSYEKITAKINAITFLPVKVTNKSDLTWPAIGGFDGKNKISLSYRWLTLSGEQIEGYTPRFPLHYDLAPGESITLDVEIKAPSAPGIYIAEFDMVQEHVSWFANKGSETARIGIKVGAPEEPLDISFTIAHEALPDEGFRAEISPAYEKITAKINATTVLPVKVTNKSNLTWPYKGNFDGKSRISLSYRWLTLSGEQIEGYTPRFPLHYDLAPGESITLDVEIKAPSAPGRYIAEFDMVQELVAWFANKGSKTARIEVKSE